MFGKGKYVFPAGPRETFYKHIAMVNDVCATFVNLFGNTEINHRLLPL